MHQPQTRVFEIHLPVEHKKAFASRRQRLESNQLPLHV